MNYRHAYHAGNFADVLKHSVLALILRHLNQKPAAWRFIDTHAGIGAYDLTTDESERTGEWRSGIGRLGRHLGLATQDGVEAPAPSEQVRAIIGPYAEAIRAINPDGVLRYYPGSPAIARTLARRQDRLTLTELHTDDCARLAAHFAGDIQVKVRALDGWLALGAFVPPKERRGLVLIDPPFEEKDEFDRMARGLAAAHRRWSSGCFMLWHPLKDVKAAKAYEQALFDLKIPKLLLAELYIRKPTGDSLDGCGIAVVNPPYTLASDLEALLPYLALSLAEGQGAAHRLKSIRAES